MRGSVVILPEVTETFKRLKDYPQEGSQHLFSLLETFLLPSSYADSENGCANHQRHNKNVRLS